MSGPDSGNRGDRETARVLVTGAGGRTGRAAMDAVRRLGGFARAFVRDANRVSDVSDVEVAVGDLRDADDVSRAADRVRAVYLIAPNVAPDEVAMGRAVLAACERAGVERLVYHSVAHPQLTAMPHHADKLRVEELVIESGLSWTILQPNTYLQNLDGYVDRLRAGVYRVPYDVERPFGMVDLRDIGDVAARCALDDVGVHATLELAGPEEVSALDVAQVATELLGVRVEAERQAPDDWARENAHLDNEPLRRLHAMWAHYDHHGLTGESTVLAHLLGRAPRDLRGYLTELLAPRP